MPKGVPKESTKILKALTALSEQVSTLSKRIDDVELMQESPPQPTPQVPSFRLDSSPPPSQPVAMPTNSIGKIDWTGGIQNTPQATGDPRAKGELKYLEDEMIPPDYIKVRNQILGEDFTMSLARTTDKPAMYIEIVVPQEYSNMLPSNPPRPDKRGRIVTDSEGINGVTHFFQDVAKNLQNQQVGARPISLK